MKVEIRTPFPDTFVRSSFKTDKMKTINLTQGQVALVDDDDYDYLNQWKWRVVKSAYIDNYYVIRWSPMIKNKRHQIYMHRFIMDTPKDMQVDHIDHNGLNNQKCNLRNCSIHENQCNKRASRKSTSKYIGVSFNKNRKLFEVQISNHGKKKTLGFFKTEEQAAIIYDIAAKTYHGEFANLNFPNNGL